LDRKRDARNTDSWLRDTRATEHWTGKAASIDAPDGTAFGEAIAYACSLMLDPTGLGRPPKDLADVLARLAIGSPATCALRSLARAAGSERDRVGDADLRAGAARIAWGFRSLFNTPEVMGMLRGRPKEQDAYWQRALDYCLEGCLQAVLDEYFHVLADSLGILERSVQTIVPQLSDAVYDALTIRATNYRADDIRIGAEGVTTSPPRNLRARYALRYGTQNVEESGQVQRSSQVRGAFNSPFWPFVLVTTSVGQEGLDFHLYCHAVVHWNLPANPVDLEQRDGRVHRYKGHAIRKNVAARNGRAALMGRNMLGDPWEKLFAAASRRRPTRLGDIEPFWVYEGPATIDRYVPALPLSREVEKLKDLKRSLAVYRMVFRQPRQDDLVAYLAGMPEERREELGQVLKIDLSPRRRRRRTLGGV
jgi:Helicase conserved C-terminal domain